MSEYSAQRNSMIDLVRGMAILLVMLLHFALSYGLSDIAPRLLPPDWVRQVVINGNYGVTTFFVVSGYLIASTSIARYGGLDRIELHRFYRDRAARILPGLMLALLVIVALGLLGLASFGNGDRPDALPAAFFVPALISVLTFWHNVLMQQVGYFNYAMNIYWSLSVEESFYLLFPVVCLLARSRLMIALICCACVVIAPAYRALHVGNELYFMYGYPACFDAIAIGVLAALCPRPVELQARRVMCGIAIAAWCLVYLRGIAGNEVFGFSALAFATAVFLLTVRDACIPLKFGRGIAWFGQHSYELYLFHIVVLGCMRDAVSREALPQAWKLLWLAAFLGGSALAAALIARYLTEPARRRWRASPALSR